MGSGKHKNVFLEGRYQVWGVGAWKEKKPWEKRCCIRERTRLKDYERGSNRGQRGETRVITRGGLATTVK